MNHITSIGLDVHARSITGAAFNPMTGEIVTKKMGTAPAEIAEWILTFESPKAVYESGVTGFYLVRELVGAKAAFHSWRDGQPHEANPRILNCKYERRLRHAYPQRQTLKTLDK